MKAGLTGLVLAGGASQRMGRDKALLQLDGRALIQLVVERLSGICEEVLIVGGDPAPYAGLGARWVGDVFPGVGVLGGLHAGLQAARCELAVAVGCDMPFLNAELLLAFAGWAEGHDVALLREGEQVEPLHGAYRRTCLAPIEEAIHAGERRVVSFFPRVSVRYVTTEEVAPLDPQLRSFRNVNTAEEWQTVREEWSAG
ncbi:MAG: molybdenum cofactor guanylyltransferase [Anaerolineales bacterium]|nr:MAG: molybdenum cofactor guanylyltransferase [Anaerolineales bacterium]